MLYKYTTLPFVALQYITLQYITLHHIMSHHITSYHITWHHISLHYTHNTIQYIYNYIYSAYTHTCIGRQTDIERQTLTDDIYRQTDAQTYTHTLDKKWIIEVIRWELNPLTCNWIRNNDLKKISSKWYTMNMKTFSEKRKTDGRYVILASQNDFTLLNRRLRWPESCWEASGPLQEGKKKEKKETFLHLFRCYTHTHMGIYNYLLYTHRHAQIRT